MISLSQCLLKLSNSVPEGLKTQSMMPCKLYYRHRDDIEQRGIGFMMFILGMGTFFNDNVSLSCFVFRGMVEETKHSDAP